MNKKLLSLLVISFFAFSYMNQVDSFFKKKKKCSEQEKAAIAHLAFLIRSPLIPESPKNIHDGYFEALTEDAKEMISSNCIESDDFEKAIKKAGASGLKLKNLLIQED